MGTFNSQTTIGRLLTLIPALQVRSMTSPSMDLQESKGSTLDGCQEKTSCFLSFQDYPISPACQAMS